MRRDKADVAAAAAGRWRQIVLSLCPGMSGGALEGTYERPCPKCGGNTRFRPWNDFDERGGVRCSHCFSDRNADGFATLQWVNNWDFSTALNAVADFLNLPASPSPSMAGTTAKGARESAKPQPQPQVEDWSQRWNHWDRVGGGQIHDLVSQWCGSRPPIQPPAVMASEVMVGNWPARTMDQAVLGFYGYADPDGPPNALLLYRADGQLFPSLGKLSERKTHLVGGSKAGWIHIGGRARTARANVIWRVEGMPDGLALLPLLPPDHAVVTPSCGCGWNRSRPEANPSLLLFAGKVLIGCGDADEPGQRGLYRFLQSAKELASRVFVLPLPFEVVETHGKDLRDWIAAGADWTAIEKALRDFRKVEQLAADVFDLADPELPATAVLANYFEEGKRIIPRPIEHVINEMWGLTDNWPRRVADKLFVHESEQISWLSNPASLVAWFGLTTGATVDFRHEGGVFSKSEMFEALQQSAIQYKSVESLPHEPPMPGHYYTCGDFPDGDGEHLTWLLDRFCPADPLDRQLIVLMMATVFWGGGGGQRPIFMITANGTGSGKTTLASVVGELAGGMISIGQRDSVEKITERMLTNEGRDKRILFVDNIKATRFSSADIEQLVTAPVISGRELYRGESQRPNNLTWIMTMNGVSTGKDIAERTILIELRRPEYSGKWTDETMSYVREHRKEIICDLLAFLRGPREKLLHSTRWGPWDDAVVSRLADPDPVMELIRSRQRAVDVDADEALLVQDYFRDRLEDLRFDVAADAIFIPASIANQWHCAALNERMGVQKTSRWLVTQIEQGVVVNLSRSRNNTQRGFVWRGENASPEQEILPDIEHRIEMDRKTSGGFVPRSEK